jgi:cytochrome b
VDETTIVREVSMNDSSLPQSSAGAATPVDARILVWDLPVRVSHWLLATSFLGAWLTAEGEQWRLLHVTLGYTVLGLVGFRLVWGVLGTRHARFASFVRGPSVVARYLASLLHRQPQHYTGHNPAGAIAILALLLLGLAVGISGWATYALAGGEAYEDVHEVLATLMLVVVGLHIVGVLVGSWVHRENLVGAMITGRKHGAPADGIEREQRGLGLLLLAAVLGFWWWQLQHPAQGVARSGDTEASQGDGQGDKD